jgi:hypothetical protein
MTVLIIVMTRIMPFGSRSSPARARAQLEGISGSDCLSARVLSQWHFKLPVPVTVASLRVSLRPWVTGYSSFKLQVELESNHDSDIRVPGFNTSHDLAAMAAAVLSTRPAGSGLPLSGPTLRHGNWQSHPSHDLRGPGLCHGQGPNRKQASEQLLHISYNDDISFAWQRAAAQRVQTTTIVWHLTRPRLPPD